MSISSAGRHSRMFLSGIHPLERMITDLDSRLRGNDGAAKLFPHFLVLIVFSLLALPSLSAKETNRNYYNEIAVEFPVDGGAMIMASRMWPLGKYIHWGVTTGGGIIERKFDVGKAGGEDIKGETKALVLPYIGPRIILHGDVFGVSIGWGAYYAKTNFDVKGGGFDGFSGETKGWGTGFYSPLVVLNFYHKKWDMLYGIGLGGFAGTSYSALEATSPNSPLTVTSEENPLDTVTLSLRLAWSGNRKKQQQPDDYFAD